MLFIPLNVQVQLADPYTSLPDAVAAPVAADAVPVNARVAAYATAAAVATRRRFLLRKPFMVPSVVINE